MATKEENQIKLAEFARELGHLPFATRLLDQIVRNTKIGATETHMLALAQYLVCLDHEALYASDRRDSIEICEEAVELATEAIDLLKGTKHVDHLRVMLYRRGKALYNLGNYQDAVEDLRTAVDMTDPNSNQAATFQSALGLAMVKAGHGEGLALAQSASIGVSKHWKDNTTGNIWLSGILLNLTQTYIHLGKLNQAEEILYSAAEHILTLAAEGFCVRQDQLERVTSELAAAKLG